MFISKKRDKKTVPNVKLSKKGIVIIKMIKICFCIYFLIGVKMQMLTI